jgi:two-component system nitrogen regulation response regulator GlnG
VHVPSLRERREDIVLLAKHFLAQAAKELKVEPKILRADTEQVLATLDWPGNVRQLENVCRWLTVMAPGVEIHPEDLPPELKQAKTTSEINDEWEQSLRRWTEKALTQGQTALMDVSTPKYESVMIMAALHFTAGRRQEAARLLGLGRNTLTRKIKELGLNVELSDEAFEEEEVP